MEARSGLLNRAAIRRLNKGKVGSAVILSYFEQGILVIYGAQIYEPCSFAYLNA